MLSRGSDTSLSSLVCGVNFMGISSTEGFTVPLYTAATFSRLAQEQRSADIMKSESAEIIYFFMAIILI